MLAPVAKSRWPELSEVIWQANSAQWDLRSRQVSHYSAAVKKVTFIAILRAILNPTRFEIKSRRNSSVRQWAGNALLTDYVRIIQFLKDSLWQPVQ
jgi:hypothetical protein